MIYSSCIHLYVFVKRHTWNERALLICYNSGLGKTPKKPRRLLRLRFMLQRRGAICRFLQLKDMIAFSDKLEVLLTGREMTFSTLKDEAEASSASATQHDVFVKKIVDFSYVQAPAEEE